VGIIEIKMGELNDDHLDQVTDNYPKTRTFKRLFESILIQIIILSGFLSVILLAPNCEQKSRMVT
jgi:hypothetical protein